MSFLKLYPHIPWSPDPEFYDCSNRTDEEWAARGTPSLFMGLFSIAIGSIILGLYLVTLIAMTNREFLQRSCYQMMYFTSLLDILNLFISNFVPGYFLIVGATYCTHPQLNYFLGSLGTGAWCGLSMSIMSLGLGRLAEVTGYGKWMFEGRMTFFWMCLGLGYLLFVATMTRPMLFNSTIGCWIMVPFITDDFPTEHGTYINLFVKYTDLIVPFIITVTYFIIVVTITWKQSTIVDKKAASYARKLLLQCTTICLVYAICGFTFFILIMFPTPHWFLLFAEGTYQLSECSPPIACLIFNTKLRNKVLDMLKLKRSHVANTYSLKNTNSNVSTKKQPTQLTETA